MLLPWDVVHLEVEHGEKNRPGCPHHSCALQGSAFTSKRHRDGLLCSLQVLELINARAEGGCPLTAGLDTNLFLDAPKVQSGEDAGFPQLPRGSGVAALNVS